MAEFVGYKDPIGNGEYNMGLTDEEVIRCRDCKHFRKVPYHDGSIKTKCSGVFTFIEPNPDGFCAWAERDA